MCTGAFEQWRPHPACTCVSVISTLVSNCRGILSLFTPIKENLPLQEQSPKICLE